MLPTDGEDNLSESDDSDKEDDIIKPDDNLILVGRVDGDASIFEVYGKIIKSIKKFNTITQYWIIFSVQ